MTEKTQSRCPTGITGLDNMLGGGLPRGRTILVSGSCGTGKTTLALQFLMDGISKYNEPGIYVTLEQSGDEIRKDALQFGWDLPKLEAERKLLIIDTSLSKIGIKDFITTLPISPTTSFSLLPDEFDLNKIVGLTVEAARKLGARRIVVDSLPALDVLFKETHDIRRALVNLNYEFKASNLTTILIGETEDEDGVTKIPVADYISDGVILLKNNEALDMRTIRIRKMRTAKHTLKPQTYEITPKGIEIKEAKSIL
ncbi:Circadian clock protein kinase KaiC [uncultured archaeon]|nr:Circadian clock protein kinase KaiC [uncultured archaeon]